MEMDGTYDQNVKTLWYFVMMRNLTTYQSEAFIMDVGWSLDSALIRFKSPLEDFEVCSSRRIEQKINLSSDISFNLLCTSGQKSICSYKSINLSIVEMYCFLGIILKCHSFHQMWIDSIHYGILQHTHHSLQCVNLKSRIILCGQKIYFICQIWIGSHCISSRKSC